MNDWHLSKEEEGLIHRALVFYSEHPEYMTGEQYFGTEVQDAEKLAKVFEPNDN